MKTLYLLRRKLALGLSLAILLALIITTFGLVAVWTDQQDYSPGDIVTISGDNRDGAGFMAGETVQVDVRAPADTPPPAIVL